MREIITRWTGQNSPGGLSIMYFNETAATATEQRAALQAFWTGIKGNLTSTTSWSIDPEGREINEANGTLVGAWADGAARVGSGTISSRPVPNASQLLFRWATADVVNGRRIKGRTFVPGFAAELSDGGEVSPAYVATMSTAATNFVFANVGFGVWHRPGEVTGGSHHSATAGSCWRELAVQRGRRG